MAQNHKTNIRGVLRLGLFAFAACLGILGCILALDAFFPKEKPTTVWTPFIEFLTGAIFVVLAFYIGRKNRLARTESSH